MSKRLYFIIQTIMSIVLATIIWWSFLKNASFGFYGNRDNFAGVILVVGAAIYLLLTIIYMVIGYKKIMEWKAWIILVSMLICVGAGFLSIFIVVYGSELINKL